MYKAWQEEFSPVTIEVGKRDGDKVSITVTARKDFPSYVVKGYSIKYNDELIRLPILRPGEQQQLTFSAPGNTVEIKVIKPGGFVILNKRLKL